LPQARTLLAGQQPIEDFLLHEWRQRSDIFRVLEVSRNRSASYT
jgi:hypothetical protein